MATAATLALRGAISRKARLWDRSLFGMVPKKHARADHDGKFRPEDLQFTGTQGFKTQEGHTCAVHPSGAFVRIDKARRGVKARKAAKRAERKAAA